MDNRFKGGLVGAMKKPVKPIGPFEPKAPLKTVQYIESRTLSPNDMSGYSLLDIIDIYFQKIDKSLVDISKVTFWEETDYYFHEKQTHIEIKIDLGEIPNPDYDKQYCRYTKEMHEYNKSLEKFKEKMKVYRRQVREYNKQLKLQEAQDIINKIESARKLLEKEGFIVNAK